MNVSKKRGGKRWGWVCVLGLKFNNIILRRGRGGG